MNFIEGTKEAIRTGLCNYFSFAGKGYSYVNELSPVDLPDFGSFWNRVLCDRNEPLPPPNSSGFEGGQCPGVQYRWRWRVDAGGGNIVESGLSPRTATGPLVVTEVGSPGGLFEAFMNGVRFYVSTPYDPDAFNYEIFGVERLDGQPDTCGNPPINPDPFPPSGDTTNITINYTNNEGDSVTELGDLRIFAPVVIAPVTVVAPIRVDLPDVSFNGNVTLSPEFSIELNPPSFRRGPGESEEPPNPEVPSTDPTTPEDDDSRELVGAITVVTGGLPDGPATQLFGGGGPDLFVPRVGTLTFRVRAANALSWSEPLDIKLSTQFHPAPENAQALAAVVQPYSGYAISVTPVYRDSQA